MALVGGLLVVLAGQEPVLLHAIAIAMGIGLAQRPLGLCHAGLGSSLQQRALQVLGGAA
jgi:hypothetical protein